MNFLLEKSGESCLVIGKKEVCLFCYGNEKSEYVAKHANYFPALFFGYLNN
jgi:hypothetical protein